MRRLIAATIFSVCIPFTANAACSDWFITPDCGTKGLVLTEKRAGISTDFSASRRMQRADQTISVVDDSRYVGVGGMEFREPARSQKRSVRHAKRIKRNLFTGYVKHLGKTASRDLSGFPSPLINKVREIESACGSHVISAFRPGARVAGTGHRSLHSIKRAVDMQGNPSCMYAHLRNWPGGYSTDYGRMQHIHISYAPGGQEWGARFAHYGGSKRVRYAARRHRYAIAQ
jgi:hypothetical protein